MYLFIWSRSSWAIHFVTSNWPWALGSESRVLTAGQPGISLGGNSSSSSSSSFLFCSILPSFLPFLFPFCPLLLSFSFSSPSNIQILISLFHLPSSIYQVTSCSPASSRAQWDITRSRAEQSSSQTPSTTHRGSPSWAAGESFHNHKY